MDANLKVFISYSNVDFSRSVAEKLATRLIADKYDVFWDVKSLQRGEKWAEAIYDNIYDSDVLLVLLEEQTAESQWVQREVDVARGAHVQILPISLVDNINKSDTMERLALRDVQFLPLRGGGDDEREYQVLVSDIEKLAKRTDDAQVNLTNILIQKRRGSPAENNPHFATFRLPNTPPDDERRILLATGDITALRDVDVLVNSENDYMQMARVHESTTVSSRLRFDGSLVKGALLLEDTIQQELDIKVHQEFPGRPIGMGNVVITSAGHKEGKLHKRHHIRYLIHAATVAIVHQNVKITATPIETNEGIHNCVVNCLEAVAQIDAAGGVISPDGEQHDEQEQFKDDYQPIHSIAFPLIGTGLGGRSTAEIVPSMLKGIQQFWTEFPASPLKHIYLVAYRKRDAGIVYKIMGEMLEAVTGIS